MLGDAAGPSGLSASAKFMPQLSQLTCAREGCTLCFGVLGRLYLEPFTMVRTKKHTTGQVGAVTCSTLAIRRILIESPSVAMKQRMKTTPTSLGPRTRAPVPPNSCSVAVGLSRFFPRKPTCLTTVGTIRKEALQVALPESESR